MYNWITFTNKIKVLKKYLKLSVILIRNEIIQSVVNPLTPPKKGKKTFLSLWLLAPDPSHKWEIAGPINCTFLWSVYRFPASRLLICWNTLSWGPKELTLVLCRCPWGKIDRRNISKDSNLDVCSSHFWADINYPKNQTETCAWVKIKPCLCALVPQGCGKGRQLGSPWAESLLAGGHAGDGVSWWKGPLLGHSGSSTLWSQRHLNPLIIATSSSHELRWIMQLLFYPVYSSV